MYARHRTSDELLRRADFQAGVLSQEQCLADGLTPSLAGPSAAEGWQRLGSGLYLTRPGEPSFEAYAWAGVLRAGEHGALGFEAAAYAPCTVDVWVPGGRQLSAFGRVRFHRDQLGRTPVGRPGGTDRADTALDLCARADPDGIVRSLALASRGGTRPEALRRALAQRTCQPHRGADRRHVRRGRRRRRVSAPAALRPRRPGRAPASRRPASGRDDRRPGRPRAGAELDGLLGHAGRGEFRDARRDNRHAESGLVTLRYGWSDTVSRPCQAAGQVGRVLRTRGWAGRSAPCGRPSCRTV
ncbi:hypothetical protein [Mariniluteicoccus endophyticus]